jgi:hypothetical protein
MPGTERVIAFSQLAVKGLNQTRHYKKECTNPPPLHYQLVSNILTSKTVKKCKEREGKREGNIKRRKRKNIK